MILTSALLFHVGLSIAAVLAYGAAALLGARSPTERVRFVTLLAWLLHGLALAWSLGGQTASFGFAPALSLTAWLVIAGYAIESHLYPQLQARWTIAGTGMGTVLLALIFPGSPLSIHASPWLPLHLALGIASYGLFAAAAAHAWLLNRTEDRIRLASSSAVGLPLLTIERLTFRFVHAGFVLLSATLLMVILIGPSLYGHGTAWKWDHKSVFSILSWLTFAVLILGRMRFGWRGRSAARVLYIGTALLFLAYVGSRFVLEVILERVP
jgi:ABC-type uncharacterized transport system permease subunit